MRNSSEHVVWHEGLLLAPQHMQVQSRYHDAQLDQRLTASVAHAWGLVQMTFDDESLSTGTVNIPKARAILQSGTVIAWDIAQGDAPLSRTLSAAAAFLTQTPTAPDGSRKLDIYFGLAQEREGVANVAVDDAPQHHQRYRSSSRVIAERTFAKTTPVEVLLAAPHVQLLFAHELSKDMQAMRIAELTLCADGFWRRLPAFTPPCLRLHQHTYWIDKIERVVRRLRRHAERLSPIGQVARCGQAIPRWSDVECLMQLRALQSIIELATHIIEDTLISPREAFILLKQALAFGTALPPERLWASVLYDHVAQHTWLEAMVGRLESMAPAQRVEVVALPIEQVGQGRWQSCLPPKHFSAKAQLILELAASASADEMALRWQRQAKLAAPDALEHLLRSALSGIGLSALKTLPDGMHPKAAHLYMRLDMTDPSWAGVAAAGTIAIAPPKDYDAIEGAKLLLVETLETGDLSR